jgi:hypothetical protein
MLLAMFVRLHFPGFSHAALVLSAVGAALLAIAAAGGGSAI